MENRAAITSGKIGTTRVLYVSLTTNYGLPLPPKGQWPYRRVIGELKSQNFRETSTGTGSVRLALFSLDAVTSSDAQKKLKELELTYPSPLEVLHLGWSVGELLDGRQEKSIVQLTEVPYLLNIETVGMRQELSLTVRSNKPDFTWKGRHLFVGKVA